MAYSWGNVALRWSGYRQEHLLKIAAEITSALRICRGGDDSCKCCRYYKENDPYYYCMAELKRDAADLIESLLGVRKEGVAMNVRTVEFWQDTARRYFGDTPAWSFSCPNCKARRTISDTVQAGEDRTNAYTRCPSCGYVATDDGLCDIVCVERGKRIAVFPFSPRAYDDRYAKWRYEDLPIVPDEWLFEVPKAKGC